MSVEAEVKRPRVWPILQKRAAGQALTDDERQTLAEYYRRYSKSKKGLYVREALVEEWEALADQQGVSFSEWATERIMATLQGDTPEIRDLREALRKATAEIDTLHRTVGALSEEKGKSGQRIEAMERELMEALSTLIKAGVEPA